MTLMNMEILSNDEYVANNERTLNLLESKTGNNQVHRDIVDLKSLHDQQEKDHEFDDCEKIIKLTIPTIDFTEPEYPHPTENDRHSLRVSDFK